MNNCFASCCHATLRSMTVAMKNTLKTHQTVTVKIRCILRGYFPSVQRKVQMKWCGYKVFCIALVFTLFGTLLPASNKKERRVSSASKHATTPEGNQTLLGRLRRWFQKKSKGSKQESPADDFNRCSSVASVEIELSELLDRASNSVWEVKKGCFSSRSITSVTPETVKVKTPCGALIPLQGTRKDVPLSRPLLRIAIPRDGRAFAAMVNSDSPCSLHGAPMHSGGLRSRRDSESPAERVRTDYSCYPQESHMFFQVKETQLFDYGYDSKLALIGGFCGIIFPREAAFYGVYNKTLAESEHNSNVPATPRQWSYVHDNGVACREFLAHLSENCLKLARPVKNKSIEARMRFFVETVFTMAVTGLCRTYKGGEVLKKRQKFSDAPGATATYCLPFAHKVALKCVIPQVCAVGAMLQACLGLSCPESATSEVRTKLYTLFFKEHKAMIDRRITARATCSHIFDEFEKDYACAVSQHVARYRGAHENYCSGSADALPVWNVSLRNGTCLSGR